jgi:hypothetical protein
MKRLLTAITELIEARAEQLREETSTLQLGVFARGYQEGRADIMETYGFEEAFIGSDDDSTDDD